MDNKKIKYFILGLLLFGLIYYLYNIIKGKKTVQSTYVTNDIKIELQEKENNKLILNGSITSLFITVIAGIILFYIKPYL